MTSTPHDALVKATFAEAEHMAGELAAVLPPEIVRRIDLATLKLEPGSFVDDELTERHSDLLYSARIGGREACIYVLFEHQSAPDPLMPFRLLRYMVRVWEHFLAEHGGAEKLPAILPVVLHHGESGWTAARSFEELVDLPDDDRAHFGSLLPRFSFVLDDLSRHTDEALLGRAMTAFARLVLIALKHARSAEDFADLIQRFQPLLLELLRGDRGVRALSLVFRYLLEVRPALDVAQLRGAVAGLGPEVEDRLMTIAQSLIEQGRNEGRTEGRTEGRAEGRADGERLILLRLLQLKFGKLPEAVMARVQGADEATLGRWAERVLSASSLDDLFSAA